MVEIRRILCPIDFSDGSRHALAYAAAVAARHGATLTVLHVYAVRWAAAYAPGAPELPSVALTADDRAVLLQQMQQFVAESRAPHAQVTTVLREGGAVDEILSAAAANAADLLVIGSHGRSGFQRLVLGSVAETLIRSAECPVLTVRQAAAAPAFAHVLCPVDFSDASRRALAYAASLVEEPGGRLTLLHVMELPPELPVDWHETTPAGPRSMSDYIAAYQEDSRARLDAAVPDALRTRCQVERMVVTGRPHAEILRIAAAAAHDLIVMGTHGRGVVERLFVGSTAQHVVRQAPCPVLTLRG